MDYYGIETPNLFSFVNDWQYHQFLKSAHMAVTKCNLWEWIKCYEPPKNFIYDDSRETELIRDEMKKHKIAHAHGVCYSFILKDIQYIARNGYQQYECDYINNF